MLTRVLFQRYLQPFLALLVLLHSIQSSKNGIKMALFKSFEPLEVGQFEPSISFQTVNLCKIYDVNFNCQFCIRDHYLNNGACVAINYSNLISGCNIYANLTTCNQCDNGLFLSNNGQVCAAGSPVSGCVAYLSQTVCATCQAGWALSNGVCTNIPNCLLVSSQGTCTTCASGYYGSTGGVCVQVGVLIANCQMYSSNATCSQCSLGFALSVDSSTCFSGSQVSQQVDSNCVSLLVNNGQKCAVCREGYFLKNNACQQLDATDSCFIFNPDNTAQCWVCMAGHSMVSSNGVCSVNSAVGQAQVNPVTSGTELTLQKIGLLLLAVLVSR